MPPEETKPLYAVGNFVTFRGSRKNPAPEWRVFGYYSYSGDGHYRYGLQQVGSRQKAIDVPEASLRRVSNPVVAQKPLGIGTWVERPNWHDCAVIEAFEGKYAWIRLMKSPVRQRVLALDVLDTIVKVVTAPPSKVFVMGDRVVYDNGMKHILTIAKAMPHGFYEVIENGSVQFHSSQLEKAPGEKAPELKVGDWIVTDVYDVKGVITEVNGKSLSVLWIDGLTSYERLDSSSKPQKVAAPKDPLEFEMDTEVTSKYLSSKTSWWMTGHRRYGFYECKSSNGQTKIVHSSCLTKVKEKKEVPVQTSKHPMFVIGARVRCNLVNKREGVVDVVNDDLYGVKCGNIHVVGSVGDLGLELMREYKVGSAWKHESRYVYVVVAVPTNAVAGAFKVLVYDTQDDSCVATVRYATVLDCCEPASLFSYNK